MEGRAVDVVKCSASGGSGLSCQARSSRAKVVFEECPYLESGRLMAQDGSLGQLGDCETFGLVATAVS